MTFERFRPFTGLLVTAEDWQRAQDYERTKQTLHNLHLHGYGVIPGRLGDLDVTVTEQGNAVLVGTGMAIDRAGRELYVDTPRTLPFPPRGYSAGTTLYVVLAYAEEPFDRRENVANPQYSGHAFVRETAEARIATELAEDGSEIELARVRLGANRVSLAMPFDPANPQDNEIDRRYRPYAGVARGQFTLADFAVKVLDARTEIAAGDIARVHVEEVREGDRYRFYLVSAYPTGEATISSSIQATHSRKGSTSYTVVLTNHAQESVEVWYCVYRIQ